MNEKYVENIITSDGRCTGEIRNIIGQAKRAFYKKKSLLMSNDIYVKFGKNLFEPICVWNDLLKWKWTVCTAGKAKEKI